MDNLWTAVLKCRDCGTELNRAEHVPEKSKAWVALTSAFAANACPKGCRSTFNDLNINTTLEWFVEIPNPVVPTTH